MRNYLPTAILVLVLISEIRSQNGPSFVLSSTGDVAERHGGKLGIYDSQPDGDKTRYEQRGGDKHIYCLGQEGGMCNSWILSGSLGSENGGLKTSNLGNTGMGWYYADKIKYGFINNDITVKFVPLSTNSCILRESIMLIGPAILKDYLGDFTIVQGKFSAGRPVWENAGGKVLKIIPGTTRKEKKERTFGVYDNLSSSIALIRSGSAPTCPTNAKAAHNERTGRGWQYWDGKDWVEDDTISAI
eukprot:GFUD01034243.1.p1 GENE.GFUD01034243.1~~GFUD01034243.1.p1  ORF type:complete len:244 (+),score=30.33 GFUD01034243.1:91-822(+)